MALTLGQTRPILWKYVSNVAYETAQDSDISNFDLTLNRLCERLFTEGKWRSMFRRVTLRTYGNKLTLPRHFSTCLGADPICSDGSGIGIPMHIYSHLAASGPALTSDAARACSIRGLIPVSDSVQTFVDPTGTFKLRAKSTSPSNRGLTFVGGLDENGEIIEDDVRLVITNGTTTTTQEYTEMPFIEKAITSATVSLYSVDTTTLEETLLCSYEPSETVPAYKRYVISTAADGSTFSCLCKLAFVPAINDSDLVIPSVLDALILGLMSFQFRDKNDAERSALYMGPNFPGKGDSTARPLMAGAIDVLDSDKSEDESAEIPMFTISSEFGAGNIYHVH
jgi:hypothetical protein